jgi:phenylpyruvate tautomerase PptA (4-oxalocrotonate tautomerase family)
MPILKIETNQTLSKEDTSDLMQKSTDMLCRVLDKPKTFMMVYIDSGCSIMFNGTNEPFALVQLRLFAVPDDAAPGIIKEITEFTQKELDIKPDRMYIQLSEMKPEHFGWDGKPC